MYYNFSFVLFSLLASSILLGQQWTRIGAVPATDIPSLFARGDTIIAGTDSAIYLSTDRGITWSRSSTIPDAPIFVDAITISNNTIIIGTGGKGVFTSSDNGASWQPMNNGLGALGSMYIVGFVERNNTLFAGTSGGGVFMLQGNNWSSFGNLVGSQAGNVEFIGSYGDTLMAGAGGNGIFWFAPPGATSWSGKTIAPLQSEAMIVYSIVSFEGLLYAGSTYGIHRSSDGGETWAYCGSGIPNSRRVRLIPVGETLYATATGINTLWYKSNNGFSWSFEDQTIYSYVEKFYNGYFLAARGDGLWRQEMPTKASVPEILPDKLFLDNIYPNPFNPATRITFTLPKRMHVTLTIVDPLGRIVERLMDEEIDQGRASVKWNGNNFPSGIYFVHLRAEYFSKVRSVVLVK